jgi:hypothetical protein
MFRTSKRMVPVSRHSRPGGLVPIQLDNGVVRVTLFPDLGGKISSIVRIASGHEFLLGPEDTGRTYHAAKPGQCFEKSDLSGFDECVPTIAPCAYPGASFGDVWLPDHGDLWSIPWSVLNCDRQKVILEVRSPNLPYSFQKRVHLVDQSILLTYKMTNLGDARLLYLWSAHPLLRVEAGQQILLPPEVHELWINSCCDNWLGRHGETCGWPSAQLLNGGNERLDVVPPSTAGVFAKLFTPRLQVGRCALFKARANESISFHFDPEQTPYLGLWLCYRGWPPGTKAGDYTVALEPCGGRPDSLEEAFRRGECQEIPPRRVRRWWLRVNVSSGMPHEIWNGSSSASN